MTHDEHQALQFLNRALRPTALHAGPIPAQMASDLLSDLAAAVLALDRPLSMPMLDAVLKLAEMLRDEITA